MSDQIEVISTCFDCQRAKIYRGHGGSRYEPPEPDEAECTHGDLSEDQLEVLSISEKVAQECPYFSPKLVGPCWFCKKDIPYPAYIWRLEAHGLYADFPVCSEKCKRSLELRENIHLWKDKIRRWREKTGQLEEASRSYCPECEIEIEQFSKTWSWWISESGRLYCWCPHCEQEVEPYYLWYDVRVLKPYRECVPKEHK